MLAKRMMKMMSTATETIPPVVELYYGYPLYLRSLLLGKRSNILKNLDR